MPSLGLLVQGDEIRLVAPAPNGAAGAPAVVTDVTYLKAHDVSTVVLRERHEVGPTPRLSPEP